MSDEIRRKYLSHRDDFNALENYIKDLLDNGMSDDAEKVILDAQKTFAIPVKIVEYFFSKKKNEEILKTATRDFPLSLDLFKLKLGFSENKEKIFENNIETIGVFNAEFWDLYRKNVPQQENAIWQKEFKILINGLDNVKTLFEMENIDTTAEIPEPSPRQKEIDEILTVYKNDFSNIKTCFALLDKEESQLNYEQCINYHPYNPTIWLKYLKFMKNPEDLSERSIRFCFKSGRIWSLRLDHSTDFDMEKIKYMDSPLDANLLLGRLCSMDKENTEAYVSAFLGLDVFQKTEAFIFANILLDDFYILAGKQEERANVLKSLTDKYPKRSDLWTRRIEYQKALIPKDEKNIELTRSLYKEAISSLDIDRMHLVYAWMSFESTVSEDYSEVVEFIAEEETKNEKTKGKEEEKQFEEKTIFVSNFGDKMTKNILMELFGDIGKIVRISLKTKFAFIEFETPSDAERAIKEMNGKQYNEFTLNVQPHVNKEKHTLFIKFDQFAKQEALIAFLKQKTGVDKITYRFSKNSKAEAAISGCEMKGHGFLDVSSATDATKLLAISKKELFNGKQIIIEVARNEKKEAHDVKVKKAKNETRDDKLRKYFGFF